MKYKVNFSRCAVPLIQILYLCSKVLPSTSEILRFSHVNVSSAVIKIYNEKTAPFYPSLTPFLTVYDITFFIKNSLHSQLSKLVHKNERIFRPHEFFSGYGTT